MEEHIMAKTDKSPREYWDIFCRRKWFFIFPVVTVLCLSAALAFELPNIYNSETLIFVEPQKVPEDYVKPTITAKIEDRLKTITQQILSRTRLEKIIEEYDLYRGISRASWFQSILSRIPRLGTDWYLKPLEMDLAVDRMRKDIEVEVKGDNVFSISYQWVDPQVTKQVTDRLANLFIDENLKVREEQAEGTSEFLENELDKIREVMDVQERQIKDFKQRYMGELPEQLNANLRTLDRFQMDLKSTVERLKAAEERRQSLERVLASVDPATGVGDNVLMVKLKDLQTKLLTLRGTYRDDYPEVVQTRKAILEIKRILSDQNESVSFETSSSAGGPQQFFGQEIAEEIRNLNLEVSTLRARRVDLINQIRIYEKRVENTPAREQQLMTIMRDYENIRKNYQSLLDKRMEARISENLERLNQGEIFRVLDPANLPHVPVRPNRMLFLFLGAVAACLIGAGMVVLREKVDHTYSKEAELTESIGLPMLASIPYFSIVRRYVPLKPFQKEPLSKLGRTPDLPMVLEAGLNFKEPYRSGVPEPSSMIVEQFRMLHASLVQWKKSKNAKVLCVTSAVQGEGKTFVAVNLAMVMARDFGMKTLLMDMDFQRTRLQYLPVSGSRNGLGWGDLVSENMPFDQALTPFFHENLFLLKAGRLNAPSSSLIASLGSSDMLHAMRETFDFILMDAPPILPVADMKYLGELVDGALMVIRAEKTPQDLVNRALQCLRPDLAVGGVLNGVKRNLHGYYRSYAISMRKSS